MARETPDEAKIAALLTMDPTLIDTPDAPNYGPISWNRMPEEGR